MRITFDESARDFVINAFGKSVGGNGYIVEGANRTQRVLTPRGEYIKVDEFAGIRKGSAVFVKSDIVSLIEAAEAMS